YYSGSLNREKEGGTAPMRVSSSKRVPARPSRVILDRVMPAIDNGRFAARCCRNSAQAVEAVVICDGHEILKADLLFRHESTDSWKRRPMQAAGNDIYRAAFPPDRPGTWFYTVEAAIDHHESWRSAFIKKIQAGEA